MRHGTRSMYNSGCSCRACRAANTAYCLEWELRVGRKKYGAEKWEQIRPKAEHGTDSAYSRGCRCALCKDGHRVAHARYAAAARRRPTPRHVHGTANGYTYYGCRCKPCTAAQMDKWRLWYERVSR